jgi:hypothetical protein
MKGYSPFQKVSIINIHLLLTYIPPHTCDANTHIHTQTNEKEKNEAIKISQRLAQDYCLYFKK